MSRIAEYQRALGRSLVDLLPGGLAAERILQIGASSTDFSRLLLERHPESGLWVIDPNAKRLITHAEAFDGRVKYALVDSGSTVKKTQRQIERARFPHGGFDLVANHSELPHLEDLAVHFYFARLLLGGGAFYVATGPGPNHLPELYSILGLPPHLLGRSGAYPVDHVAHLAEAAGLEVIRRVTTGGTFEVETPAAVLDHARATGLLPKALRGPRLREVVSAYEAGFGRSMPTAAVRATFDQWLLCLRSPGPLPRRISAAADPRSAEATPPAPEK